MVAEGGFGTTSVLRRDGFLLADLNRGERSVTSHFSAIALTTLRVTAHRHGTATEQAHTLLGDGQIGHLCGSCQKVPRSKMALAISSTASIMPSSTA